jgi:hypothetical protein
MLIGGLVVVLIGVNGIVIHFMGFMDLPLWKMDQ